MWDYNAWRLGENMSITAKPLTYTDYLALPEIKKRYEIIDGELIFMTPAPTERHQRIARALFRLIDGFVVRRGLGEVYFAPLDILVSREPLRTRQPDLLFISRERASIIREQIEGGPDLVIEILSPATSRAQVADKLTDYASIGVRECWIVSPEAQTVEVLELAEGQVKRTGLYGMGDRVVSRALADLNLFVADIFQESHLA